MRKLWLVIAVLVVSFSFGVHAQDAEANTTEKSSADETKLLKLTTLEQAFLKANQDRNLLQTYLLQQNQKLEQTENEEEQGAIRRKIGDARKKLYRLEVAMEVVFGIGRRRQWDYDPVKSMIYLKVGTVEEVFERAVRTREALRKFVLDKTAEKETAADAEKVAELEKQIEDATRQYQVVAAALQTIFGVVPQRNYTYDPRNSTLYLKVSEKEVEELKAKVEELQEKQAEEAAKGTHQPE